VQPLGSKQALSNGNEPEELTELLRAFEEQNRVAITIQMKLAPQGSKKGLLVLATATSHEPPDSGVTHSGSVSAVCWGNELVSLMGLFSTLLYRLDFAIAEAEWVLRVGQR
jgi:hypothetical protein